MQEKDVINFAYKIHKNVEEEVTHKIEENHLKRKELEILLSINELGGSATPTEIAEHTQIKLPLVSRITDSLVQRSILNSTRGKIDRRQNFIQLTQQGYELINTCKGTLAKLPTSLLSILSEEEKKLLTVFLESYPQKL